VDVEVTTFAEQLGERIGSPGTALVTDDGVVSADELFRKAAGAADWLDSLAVAHRDPVIALVSASAEACALLIAGMATDRPLTPLGPRLTSHELASCIAPLGGGVLVTEPAFEAVAREVAGRVGRRVEVMGSFAASSRLLDLECSPDAVVAVLHTSGTSGTPKMVPLRNDRLGARVVLNAAFLELGADCCFASISPFHHVGGMGMVCVALGCGAALMPRPRFSIDEWTALRGRRVTHATLAPTMIDMLVEAGELSMPGLRLLQYGSSPMHPDTLTAAMAALPEARFVSLYGQTEGTPITCLTPEDHLTAMREKVHLLHSVGRPVPNLELVIDGPDAAGIGEVVARAPHLFRPSPDGWLRTGDLGRVDGEGYVYLAGRKGDMIIRGGENIYPLEVENRLSAHPEVRDAAVVGIPDRRWGERVKAFVVPNTLSTPPSVEELGRHVRSELAGFKVPTEWEFLAELPRNSQGKVLRRVLMASR
jgi:acyl-CoA synthetase (AMP-forming)/AMP-acid ligase II